MMQPQEHVYSPELPRRVSSVLATKSHRCSAISHSSPENRPCIPVTKSRPPPSFVIEQWPDSVSHARLILNGEDVCPQRDLQGATQFSHEEQSLFPKIVQGKAQIAGFVQDSVYILPVGLNPSPLTRSRAESLLAMLLATFLKLGGHPSFIVWTNARKTPRNAIIATDQL